MNLKQWQEKHGVKRINFDEVHPTELFEQFGDDQLVCPYCMSVIDYDSDEIDDILRGEAYQCPQCNKWFYVSGETCITTYCAPIEDTILQKREIIERTYSNSDMLDSKGKFVGRYSDEWLIWMEYARPFFENQKEEASHGDH